ncbi:hypothetical protein PLACP1_29630 [Planifilum fimeticola]
MGLQAVTIASKEERKRETTMIGFRPQLSDKEPRSNMETAKEAVVTDNAKLPIAGEMENSCANTGISGCTAYRMEKVTNPPANKAPLARRKAGVPSVSRLIVRFLPVFLNPIIARVAEFLQTRLPAGTPRDLSVFGAAAPS